MIQRSGEVMIRMLANVQQVTIEPLNKAIALGSTVYTDEYDMISPKRRMSLEKNPLYGQEAKQAFAASIEINPKNQAEID